MSIILNASDGQKVRFTMQNVQECELLKTMISDCGIPSEPIDIPFSGEVLRFIKQWCDLPKSVQLGNHWWYKHVVWDDWSNINKDEKQLIDQLDEDELKRIVDAARFLGVYALENLLNVKLVLNPYSKFRLQVLPQRDWHLPHRIDLKRTYGHIFIGFTVLKGNVTAADLTIGGAYVWRTRSVTCLKDPIEPIRKGLSLYHLRYHDVMLEVKSDKLADVVIGAMTREQTQDERQKYEQDFCTETGKRGIIKSGMGGICLPDIPEEEVGMYLPISEYYRNYFYEDRHYIAVDATREAI